ncbi:metal-dependent hydrolase [Trinickia dinghuensis]|uniref:Metal-dependent hydrolase n=1 Tax=Trinickia dinghuensis TaxID=2291023 RepID=A0A3D8K519_9BURK|nr:metal-dependent hydrolase [Trinickia dinghuensis]RDV00419.1 metal-dependent hydrolase [Trinickia dinghuensis]
MSDGAHEDSPPARHRYWNRTCVRSRVFDALSLLLPAGEVFFIDTLEKWRVRSELPPDTILHAEIDRFIREENAHRQAHERYNESLTAELPEARALAQRASRVTEDLAKLSLPMQLAFVAAFEHLTTVLAEEIGTHADLIADDASRPSRLWHWHAREELGHRDVAMDVAAHAGLRRRSLTLALLLATAYLATDVLRYTFALCRCDIRQGAGRTAMLIDAVRFAFGAVPSLLRMTRGWWRYRRAPNG